MDKAELLEMYKALLPIAKIDFDTEIRQLSMRIQRIMDTLDMLEQRKLGKNKNRRGSEETVESFTEMSGPNFDEHRYYHSQEQTSDLLANAKPSPDMIRKCRQQLPKVTLNVGGSKHEVMWKMLETRPRSRLGKLSRSFIHEEILDYCDGYSLHDNEYFFDRHPGIFSCILNFYRTGRLHIMDDMCVHDFTEDLQYWGIDPIWLELCCESKYTTRKKFIKETMEKEKAYQEACKDEVEDFGPSKLAVYQQILWDTLEKPHKGLLAKYLSLFSISLVLLSTVGMCLNTMPYFRYYDSNKQPIDNPYLALIEVICISWFTVEYLLRLAGAPKKMNFIKQTMNVIDILAILPYYISLAFEDHETELTSPDKDLSFNSTMILSVLNSTKLPPEEEEEQGGGSFGNVSRILQVLRIARVMRIFKLARRSVGLQAMAHTMRKSYKQLCLLLLFVFMGMLIFGSLCYFAEKDVDGSGYTSIPESMWWAIQTLTSVGYGDLYPTSLGGKLVGVACAVSGVLVLALPIPIVVENFAAFYDDQKFQQLLQEKKEAHYADILHQYEAQDVMLKGLIKTITTNFEGKTDREEDRSDDNSDDDATNEQTSLLAQTDSGYQ